LPALPAYPQRPAITWAACEQGVYLEEDGAARLRDWLVEEQAWQEAIEEIWNTFQP
jgi:hypothetical protein